MPELVSVDRIWDHAPHNGFTDLIRFHDRWWCVFREAEGHATPGGVTRVIASDDGSTWSSEALVSEEGVDLRDAKLSITPDERLMLSMGGSVYDQSGNYLTRAPRVSFSADGRTWTTPKKLLAEDHWLWRATWHEGCAYALSKLGEYEHPRRGFLYTSVDGVEWEWLTEFEIPGVSETTLRFMPDGELIALIRPSYIGSSRPPYREWSFAELSMTIGGPNFVRHADGSLWATGRSPAELNGPTVLARMTTTTFEPVLTLPCDGDSSYAGMVWHKDLLWMSYYSSHEEGTNIYLAKVRV